MRHVAGREWRRRLGGEPLRTQAPQVAALLAWFWDRPGLDAHPFSIHSLCEAGAVHGCARQQASCVRGHAAPPLVPAYPWPPPWRMARRFLWAAVKELQPLLVQRQFEY